MEGEGEVETHVCEFNKLDEIFEDMDGDVFGKVLSFGPVHELKNRINTFRNRELTYMVSKGIIFNIFSIPNP